MVPAGMTPVKKTEKREAKATYGRKWESGEMADFDGGTAALWRAYIFRNHCCPK